jgi:hypothetical protein
MTTYKNTSDEPVTVQGPVLTIEPGKTADLTTGQANSPGGKHAIRGERLVPVEAS